MLLAQGWRLVLVAWRCCFVVVGRAMLLRGERWWLVGAQGLRKNSRSHIDASHSRQPLVKGERLVRYEVNAVMLEGPGAGPERFLGGCGSLGLGAGPGAKRATSALGEASFGRALRSRRLGGATGADGAHGTHGTERTERTEQASAALVSLVVGSGFGLVSVGLVVTPKGVPLPALCHARATREGS